MVTAAQTSFLSSGLPAAVDCLRDLRTFLRRDDEDTRPAFFRLGEYGVARACLVPLLTSYPNDLQVVENTGMNTRACLCYVSPNGSTGGGTQS